MKLIQISKQLNVLKIMKFSIQKKKSFLNHFPYQVRL